MKRVHPPPMLAAALLSPEDFQYDEALLTQSTKLNFENFQTRFSYPAKLKPNSAMERFFVRTFVETLLPACAGFPEVDGQDWNKPAIKEKLSALWGTFAEQQQMLIHAKLDEVGSFGITPGTLRQISYEKKS